MENHETPEAIKARAEQEDPLVMYLIVRETLEMSIGKTAAQCAHASQMITLKYMNDILNKSGSDKHSDFELWLESSFRKVVLRANDKIWNKIKLEFTPENMVLVIDNGLTEIPSGSETVIGLWPTKKSTVPKIIKKLQTLK